MLGSQPGTPLLHNHNKATAVVIMMLVIIDKPCWVASPDNQHNRNTRAAAVILTMAIITVRMILDRPCWVASPCQHYYIIITWKQQWQYQW